MKIAEVLLEVTNKTTDMSGHVASYSVSAAGKVAAYLEARLDKTQTQPGKDLKVNWTVTTLADDRRLVDESSPDLRGLLSRFGEVELTATSTRSGQELFDPIAGVLDKRNLIRHGVKQA